MKFQYVTIEHIGTDKQNNNVYTFSSKENVLAKVPLSDVRFLTAEEIGQEMGGN